MQNSARCLFLWGESSQFDRQIKGGLVNVVQNVSDKNLAFWNDLCGSQMARQLGITDSSRESLKKFDDWFFNYYPYLDRYIQFANLSGKKVLEVDLGYGSVAQKIALSGAHYHGLDIAEGPVAMVKHRLALEGMSGDVRQASVLEAPFDDGEFDAIVAIGCFHHTGDMQRALDESWRMLKSGGTAIVMVYNAYSYRRWVRSFGGTWRYFRHSAGGKFSLQDAQEHERALYDVNNNGDAAPHTDFFSAGHIKYMANKWQSVDVSSENVGDEGMLQFLPRYWKNKTLGRIAGLDIYCTLRK